MSWLISWLIWLINVNWSNKSFNILVILFQSVGSYKMGLSDIHRLEKQFVRVNLLELQHAIIFCIYASAKNIFPVAIPSGLGSRTLIASLETGIMVGHYHTSVCTINNKYIYIYACICLCK